jgi:hypothetical protein
LSLIKKTGGSMSLFLRCKAVHVGTSGNWAAHL